MTQRGFVVLGALAGYVLFGAFASFGFATVVLNLVTPLPAATVGMRYGSVAGFVDQLVQDNGTQWTQARTAANEHHFALRILSVKMAVGAGQFHRVAHSQ